MAGGAEQGSSFQLPSGMFMTSLLVSFIGFVAWAYREIQPPRPKICGSPNGPPVTEQRIKLRDGRHLAYEEYGVPKESAKYKFISVHAFASCRRHHVIPTETFENLGIYVVSFDRPGYGESDPDPKRSVKSIALDIEELADQLGLGAKFYVIGVSMGGQVVWGCLKYIPHRLAGATLIAPVVNYWWPGFPANLSKVEQWDLRVTHYTPWLTYWFNTQRWFRAYNVVSDSHDKYSTQDKELVKNYTSGEDYMPYVKQQGEYESMHRDLIVAFGNWEFDPMDLENPFPNNEGSVHVWQGDEDGLVPVALQRCIAGKLPWIQYHELAGAGHLFLLAEGMCDAFIKAQLHEQ